MAFYKIKINSATLGWILVAFVSLGALGLGGYNYYQNQRQQKQVQAAVQPPQNVYLGFTDEVYNIIQTNYWEKTSDEQLTEIYRLAAEKISGKPASLENKNLAGVDKMILEIIKDKDDKQKKEFVTTLSDTVLANLQPFGRSRLYTQKMEKDLSNEVNNIDPSANLYANLGVNKTASTEEINKAYEQKSQELSKDTSEEGKQKLAEVTRAHEALKTPEKKQIYDQTGIEPSVTYNLVTPEILHLRIKRFSPTTIQELTTAVTEATKQAGTKLNSLIIDFRGNIGGAIDQLPSFLSPFLGKDKYAIGLYHQGQTFPYGTSADALPGLIQMKNVIILADNQTQSSAEASVAAFKKNNYGVFVGTKTRGWGTIERIFDVSHQIDSSERYSVFLVHTVTLRDDSQPIEGRGIDPAIDIAAKDWEKQLTSRFNSLPLTAVVKNIWNNVK